MTRTPRHDNVDMENTPRSEAVKDGRGRDITIGCRIRVQDVDARDGSTYVVKVRDIDSCQDKPGDPVIVTFTLPPLDEWDGAGRDKWQYADSVQVVADCFPTWQEESK